MDYQETLSYLYKRLPLFQNKGQGAYKKGLENTLLLDAHFKHPHHKYPTIHIAGTNGKGSCSHTLAAILQSAGYKVGLYTSPHLIDFRERIRINGIPMDPEFVIEFVERERSFFEPLSASFFEVTTAMAFRYFAQEKVDVAVIEVGLGGRLDCTNVIMPRLSIITNISFDHVKLLGNTLPEIAAEKAGIIKENIPVLIGESSKETRPVFIREAEEKHAPLFFAEEDPLLLTAEEHPEGGWNYTVFSPFAPEARTLIYDNPYISQQLPLPETLHLHGELGGYAQVKNTNTILHAVRLLYRNGFNLSENDLREGFAHVCRLTGLYGRWEKLSDTPRIYCDTGHNVGGISYIVQQLSHQHYSTLRIVIGMVNDKDLEGVLELLPKDAEYYFTQASVERALPAEKLQEKASTQGLKGKSFHNVKDAIKTALRESQKEDFIFVGGSSFVVADLLALYSNNKESEI